MIPQIANSHGFPPTWISTKYHHEVFGSIVAQVAEQYEGNNIVIDHTWCINLNTVEKFTAKYPNINLNNVNHIFFVGLLDPVTWHPADVKKIVQFIQPKHVHRIIQKSKFSFWGYYAFQELNRYKDINIPWDGSKIFLSYNRKPYDHRVKLIDELTRVDVLSKGIYSLGNEDATKAITIAENSVFLNENAGGDVGVPNDIVSIGDHNVWKHCLIDLVTETIHYDNFLSEKIWKPIVGKRPFMVIGPLGTLKQLKAWGFKTFDDFWDERYNEIIDANYSHWLEYQQSCEEVADIIKAISNMSQENLKIMYDKMIPILDHNHNHFFGAFAKQNKANMLNIINEEK